MRTKNIFLISQSKHILWELTYVVVTQKNRLIGHPKYMLKGMGKKIFTILRSKMFYLKLFNKLKCLVDNLLVMQ